MFATWLGWLVADEATPLVFVRGTDQDPEEIVWQASKVGYDNLVGDLAGGVAAWVAGQPVATVPLLDPGPGRPGPGDRRSAGQRVRRRAPTHRPQHRTRRSARADVPAGPVVTMCGHGERATTAASILELAGHAGVAVLIAGAEEWAKATGNTLEVGT